MPRAFLSQPDREEGYTYITTPRAELSLFTPNRDHHAHLNDTPYSLKRIRLNFQLGLSRSTGTLPDRQIYYGIDKDFFSEF